jgi:hypothetical protein
MRWLRHAAHRGEKRNANRLVVENLKVRNDTED